MSNKIFNSDSLPSLNPMDKFEKIFLIISSDEPISHPQEIDEKTAYGTGFFINDSGLFLSVAHNFTEHKHHYLLLKDDIGNHRLEEIFETQNFVLNVACDYAIGKIDVSCNFCNWIGYNNESNCTVSGIKDKRLLGQPHNLTPFPSTDLDNDYGDDAKIDYINQCTNLYKKIYFNNTINHIVFYNTDVVLDILLGAMVGNKYKIQHQFAKITYLIIGTHDSDYINEVRDIDYGYFSLQDREQPFCGLSGSPIFNKKNKVIGIHAAGTIEIEHNEENATDEGVYRKGLKYINQMIPFDKTLISFINQNSSF